MRTKLTVETLEQRQLAACIDYGIFIHGAPPSMIAPDPSTGHFTVIEAAIRGRDEDGFEICEAPQGLTWFWGDGHFFHIAAGRFLADPTYTNRLFPYDTPGEYEIQLFEGVHLVVPTDREPVASMTVNIAQWHTVGDINGDGVFGTGDLVRMLQVGKYETGEAATFFEGDMNYDGYVDSADLVFALNHGEWME